MLKIEGLSKEAKRAIVELESIVQKTFPEAIIYNWEASLFIRFYEKRFLRPRKKIGRIFLFSKNEIYVDEPEVLEKAETLARVLENRYNHQVIIKKKYE